MQTLQKQLKPVFSKKHIPIDFLTVVLQNKILLALQPVFLRQVKFLLQVRLLCLRQAERLSR
jgi:hypothetical protein